MSGRPGAYAAKSDLPILFENAELIAIDKPSGLVVHRGSSGERDDVLARLRRQGYGKAFPIHRLDRGTSGVLVLARSSDVARSLGALVAAREPEKVYWAFVRGAFGHEEVDVDHPVPRDEGGERVEAFTRMRLLGDVEVGRSPLREKRYAWLEARPSTGRFHQVRRHAKHLGHPVLGDTTYGRSEHNRFLQEAVGLGRLALHARRFFIRGVVEVEAPLADDLAGPMRRLGFAIPSTQ